MADALRSIFGKRRLTPGQLRAVSEHRFDDAICLLESGQNARATGAMYMGGFVIECLLKACLLDRHPNLQQPVDPAKLSEQDAEVYRLLFSHELDAMLVWMPEAEMKLRSVDRALWERFRSVCEEWTVFARYSPKLAKVEAARLFVETVREVKRWLREL